MNKKLVLGMCMFFLLLVTLAYAQEYEITIFTEQLPYSDAKTIDISGDIGETAYLDYDAWLSGPGEVLFDDPLEEFDVFINIPSSAGIGNYTRSVTATLNSSNQTFEFLFIIVEQSMIDDDGDGYSVEEDCDDTDPNVNPGKEEIYFNSKDDDCNPATEDYFELQVSINKQSFRLGERPVLTINAINNSNVSIEICEQGSGFVPCYYPILLEDVTYPLQETLFSSNSSGNYIVTVSMSYNQELQTKELEYTTKNTMNLVVEGDRVIKENEKVNLTASASGGIGKYTYKWTMPDKSVKTGKQIEVSFNKPKDYEITLNVKDEYDNEITKKITITVVEDYLVTIIVKDKKTGSKIKGAVVSIDDEEETTDSDGKAIFHLIEDDYDLIISKTGYDFIIEEINVNGDKTYTYQLEEKDSDEPKVTLKAPKNSAVLNKRDIEFTFKAVDDSSMSCFLYLNNGQDSFYSLEEIIEVEDNKDHSSELELDYGSYKWRVECEDNNQNIGLSETWGFELTNETTQQASGTTETAELSERTTILEAIYDTQDRIGKFNTEQKAAAEALEMEKKLNQGIKTVERAARDLNDLVHMALTGEERQARAREINARTEALYTELIGDIKVLGTKKFVKYIREDELGPIIEDYYKDTDQKVNKQLITYLTQLQNTMTVSTDIKNLKLTYLDGSSKDITLVTLDIDYENITSLDNEKESLLLVVPKELADTNRITEITASEKSEEKELNSYLHYPFQDKIVIYLNKKQPLENAEKINLLFMMKRLPKDLSKITGRATFDFAGDFNSKKFLILIILILVPAYFLYAFDGFAKMYQLYLNFTLKEGRKVVLLVDNALTALTQKNIDAALETYQQIQADYAKLPSSEKKKVRSKVVELCKKIDVTAANVMIEYIGKMLEQGHLQNAKDNYYRLQTAYDKISPEHKPEIYYKIMNLAEKIKKAK